MANNSKAKLKLLYLMKILQEETDEEIGLSMTQIIDRLNAEGIPAERKGIYRDIKNLKEFGLNIVTHPRSPVEYAIVRDKFKLPELMLMVDAVESCKFLTRRQSNALTGSLQQLASERERGLLERRIHVHGRIRAKTEGVFEYIDLLHEAMRNHVKVSFKYYRYDHSGARIVSHNGKPITVTPIYITYWEGNYYLSSWNDEYDEIREYRIDRMGNLKITEEKATKNPQIESHADEHEEYATFGRFGGDKVTATLHVDANKFEIILDRFGDAATISAQNKDTAKAVVKVRKSDQFFGWVAGMGNKVRIKGPKHLKEEYNEYLKGLIEE